MYNNYNPYYQPRFQQPIPQQYMGNDMQNTQQPQYQPPQIVKPLGLLGKSVDSIEVVKATDIPLDGSVSYFPLVDGSAIVTKQLLNDGTSKLVIFKPTNEQKETNRYITRDDLENALKGIDLSELEDIKEEIKEMKKQIKEFKKNRGE